MLLPLLITSRVWAADVLLPEATPSSLDDFSVASMVYDLVLNEISGGMYRVEDAERIRAWAGKDADGCFDTPECPGNLWDRTDARIALVLGVGQAEGGIEVTARFYDAVHTEPIHEVKDTIPTGTELAFAKDLAMALSETIATVPARGTASTGRKSSPPSVPVATTRVDEAPAVSSAEPAEPPEEERPRKSTKKADPEPPPADEEEELARPRRAEDHDDSPVTKERKPSRVVDEEEDDIPDFNPKDDRPKDEEEEERVDAAEREVEEKDLPSTRELSRDAAKAEAERAAMKIPEGAYQRYVASGLSQDDWRKAARVRKFGFFLEAAGGYALWDTDRAYGVWVDLDEQDGNYVTTAASTWEGSGTGPDGGGGAVLFGTAGLTFTWWFEGSVSAGIQQGRKYLEAGYECSACEESVVEVAFDPVTGTQFWIQPKLRFIPVVTGVVKPYVLVSGDIALYDGFVPDTEVVDFPNAEGGLNWGVAGGLGLFVDAVPHLSFFAEVPVSVTLSPLWRSYDDPGVATQPEGIPGKGAVLRLLGGVSTHF